MAEARLRRIEARQQLLAAEGGTVGIQQMAPLLSISRQAVYKRYRAGRLLAVDRGRHGYAFPAWQFVPGGVLSLRRGRLPEVLRSAELYGRHGAV